jgi:esterase/lipase
MASAVDLRNPLAPLTLVLRYVLKYDPRGGIGDEDLVDPQAAERIWCYDETPLWGAAELYLLQRQVRRSLAEIRQPILIFQGLHDAQVPAQAAQRVYDQVSSTDKTLVWLERSGHSLLVDGEREAVWEQSFAWMMQRVPGHQDQG